MAEQGKVTGFRLDNTILAKLDELQEMEIIKNRTDGVIRAINRFHMEEILNKYAFLKTLCSITHSSQLASYWIDCEVGSHIIVLGDEPGEEYSIKKIDAHKARIVRNLGKRNMIVTVEYIQDDLIPNVDQ